MTNITYTRSLKDFWIYSKTKYRQVATTPSTHNFDSLPYAYPIVKL